MFKRVFQTVTALALVFALGFPLEFLYATPEDDGLIEKLEKTTAGVDEISKTYENDGFTFRILGDAATIIKYTGEIKNLIIPETVGPDFDAEIYTKATVKAIAESAFENNKSLEMISMPDTITSIGDRAFSGCENLFSMNIPRSLTSLGYATVATTNVKEIFVPKEVAGQMFTNAFSGIDKAVFEEGSESIGKILRNSSVKEVVIPEGVTEIKEEAFWCCWCLEEIHLPDTIESIGEKAFLDCTKLERVNMPENLRLIGEEAFRNCLQLKNLSLPEGLREIQHRAFDGCSGMSSFVIPESVFSVGNEILPESGIKDLVIPKGVTEFEFRLAESGPFWSSDLENVIFSDGRATIQAGALYGCCARAVTFSDKVRKIEGKNFHNTGIRDVYYGGTKEQWDKIDIADGDSQNDDLLDGIKNGSVTIHYNSPMPGGLVDYSDLSLKVYSDLSFSDINVGQIIGITPVICKDGTPFLHEYEWDFQINESDVAEIVNHKDGKTEYGPCIRVKGKAAGEATLKAIHLPSRTGFSIPVTVSDDRTRTYHIGDIMASPSGGINSSGLLISNFRKEASADGTKVTFDVYNGLSHTAAAELYNAEGMILDVKKIEKRTRYSTNTIEVFKSALSIPEMFKELRDGTNDFKQEFNSQSTKNIEFVVPEGGYILVSNDAKNSDSVLMYNIVDVLIWSLFKLGKMNKQATPEEEKLLTSEVQMYVADQILVELASDQAKKAAVTSFQEELCKAAEKNSISELAVAVYNLIQGKGWGLLDSLNVDLGKTIEKTSGKFAITTGETLFEELAGPAGEALKKIYKFADYANYIMLWIDFSKTAGIGSMKFDLQGAGEYTDIGDPGIIKNPDEETEAYLKGKQVNEEMLRLLRGDGDISKIEGIIAKASAYELTAVREGQDADLRMPVEVELPLPSGYSEENSAVYHMAEDGTVTLVTAQLAHGKFIFETDNTGIYVIVETENTEESVPDITIKVGKRKKLKVNKKVGKISVEDKTVVKVKKKGKKVLVTGKKAGTTTVKAYSKKGREIGSWLVEVVDSQMI